MNSDEIQRSYGLGKEQHTTYVLYIRSELMHPERRLLPSLLLPRSAPPRNIARISRLIT